MFTDKRKRRPKVMDGASSVALGSFLGTFSLVEHQAFSLRKCGLSHFSGQFAVTKHLFQRQCYNRRR